MTACFPPRSWRAAGRDSGQHWPSAKQHHRTLDRSDHLGGGAADEQVADAGVSVGTHDQQVDVVSLGMGGDDLLSLAILDVGVNGVAGAPQHIRSEERRVGKECRSGWWWERL